MRVAAAKFAGKPRPTPAPLTPTQTNTNTNSSQNPEALADGASLLAAIAGQGGSVLDAAAQSQAQGVALSLIGLIADQSGGGLEPAVASILLDSLSAVSDVASMAAPSAEVGAQMLSAVNGLLGSMKSLDNHGATSTLNIISRSAASSGSSGSGNRRLLAGDSATVFSLVLGPLRTTAALMSAGALLGEATLTSCGGGMGVATRLARLNEVGAAAIAIPPCSAVPGAARRLAEAALLDPVASVRLPAAYEQHCASYPDDCGGGVASVQLGTMDAALAFAAAGLPALNAAFSGASWSPASLVVFLVQVGSKTAGQLCGGGGAPCSLGLTIAGTGRRRALLDTTTQVHCIRLDEEADGTLSVADLGSAASTSGGHSCTSERLGAFALVALPIAVPVAVPGVSPGASPEASEAQASAIRDTGGPGIIPIAAAAGGGAAFAAAGAFLYMRRRRRRTRPLPGPQTGSWLVVPRASYTFTSLPQPADS